VLTDNGINKQTVPKQVSDAKPVELAQASGVKAQQGHYPKRDRMSRQRRPNAPEHDEGNATLRPSRHAAVG